MLNNAAADRPLPAFGHPPPGRGGYVSASLAPCGERVGERAASVRHS
jgi:hypothetical protein